MALEKQDISLDLVTGADTKANPQIDTSFQEMVNVTFDGDMTAKKMNGYDLVQSLPAGEKYSLIARRQADLLAQTDKGTYKYTENFNAFSKISEIGSCEINSNEVPGFNFAFSANYRLYVQYSPDIFNLQNSNGNQRFYFYNHDGVLINYLDLLGETPLNPKWAIATTKVLVNGDDFYVMNLQGGAEQDGTDIVISFAKFSLNVTTHNFEFVTSGGGILTAEDSITAIDCFCDGTNIFMAYSNATEKKYMRRDLNLANQLLVNMSTTPTSNIEIFSKDATDLWVSVDSVGNQNLIRVNKTTLAETSSAVIQAGISSQRKYFIYPLTNSTAIIASFLVAPSTGSVTLRPMGRIFLRNGRYYIPCLQYTTNNIASVLMLVTSNASGGLLSIGVSDTGQVRTEENQWGAFTSTIVMIPNNQSYESKDYYTALTPAKKATLVSYDYDAKETNSYIEIEKTNVFSGGLLGYFDGQEFAEYGFIGNPYISDYSTAATGSLPADTGYMLCYFYRYDDAQGNVFYSPRGPIYSGFDPVNGITLPANSRVSFNLQTPVITSKGKITIEVYIKRKNKLFQLAWSRNIYNSAPLSGSMGTFAISITTYPNTDAKIMPYQDGSIAPETISNSNFISLYADRIFRLSNDNPISLAYSQRKLSGNGFEFNDSFLYLDVLDKRGIAEDQLTGAIAMDGRIVIFKETSILYMVGSGPSRANTQDDFSEPQLVVSDVGCIQPRSIILVPDGIMFKSDKGIYLLNRKLQAGYIGSNVEKFNSYTIISSVLIESANEVRFATLEGLILVYNYLSQAWSWFTDWNCISACLWKNKYVVLKDDGKVLIETEDHHKIITAEVIQTISSPWLRLNKIQGYQKAYYVRILGVYKSLHRLKMNVYYDYELYSSEEYLIDPLAENQYNIEVKPTNEEIEDGSAINGVYQMKIDLVRKNCQAVRVVVQDIPLDSSLNSGECFALSNITINIGLKKGAAKIQALKSY